MTQAALVWNLTIAASDVTSVLLQYFQNSLLTPAFSESCLPFTLVGKCLVLFRIRPKRFDTKWSANITPPDTFYIGKKGTFGKRHLETVTQTMKVDTNDVTCVIKRKLWNDCHVCCYFLFHLSHSRTSCDPSCWKKSLPLRQKCLRLQVIIRITLYWLAETNTAMQKSGGCHK